MKKLIAKFYRNESGSEPVRNSLKELSKGDKRIVGIDIKTVEYGWPIGMPVCKPLGSGLYEVRSTISSRREVRVIFCIKENEMILLHSFIKKTNKTPLNELRIANIRNKEVKDDKE